MEVAGQRARRSGADRGIAARNHRDRCPGRATRGDRRARTRRPADRRGGDLRPARSGRGAGRGGRAPASSSAWRSGPAPSPSWPTWCSRWPPRRRSPARTSTGRVGSGPSPPRCPEAGMLDEARILDTLGVEMDVDLYTQTPAAAAGRDGPAGRVERATGHGRRARRVPPRRGRDRPDGRERRGPHRARAAPRSAGPHRWRMNLDGGRALDGEPHLAGTAKPDVVRLSAAEAAERGLVDGEPVAVRGPASTITLPLAVTRMVDDVGLAAGAHRRHRHHRPPRRRRRRRVHGRAGRRRAQHEEGTRERSGRCWSSDADGHRRARTPTARVRAAAGRRPVVAVADQGADHLRPAAAAHAVRDLVRAHASSAACSTGRARTGTARSACCSRSPTR